MLEPKEFHIPLRIGRQLRQGVNGELIDERMSTGDPPCTCHLTYGARCARCCYSTSTYQPTTTGPVSNPGIPALFEPQRPRCECHDCTQFRARQAGYSNI